MMKIVLLFVYFGFIKFLDASAKETILELVNDSDDDIDINWVDHMSSSFPPPMILLATLERNHSQSFNTYQSHLFVFSYHNFPSDNDSKIKFTKDYDKEILIFTSDKATKKKKIGKLLLEKKTISKPKKIVRATFKHQKKIPRTYGVQTRTVVQTNQREKILLTIQNESPFAFDIFWIDSRNESVHMELLNKTLSTSFDSFEGHRFFLRFQPTDDFNPPSDIAFVKSPYEEIIAVTWNEPLQEIELYVTSPYDKIENTVQSALDACQDHSEMTPQALAACLSPQLSFDYFKLLKYQDETIQFREQMIDKLRNYTCDDDNLDTTKPLSSTMESIRQKEYQVDSHLLKEEAQIFVIHDFITEKECQVLRKSAEPRLERAVVVGDGDVPVVSESRKAQQASYSLRTADDPLWDLYRRILNFTNSHTNYNLQPEGQEYFTVIQYNKDDEYVPHCDGACAGESHVSTGRVATTVLYCEVPELGGATTFTKADVFIRPKNGMATVFTYMTPDGKMDTGYTQHSGCPIRQGQKWIATAWLREGVTKEDHAEKFEPSGRRMGGTSESDRDEENYDSLHSTHEIEQGVY